MNAAPTVRCPECGGDGMTQRNDISCYRCRGLGRVPDTQARHRCPECGCIVHAGYTRCPACLEIVRAGL
jgi:DnaJ-class molecular chaperone